MLIVSSDLHFTDATAGQHNPPADAFRQVFLNQVAQQVRDPDRGVKEVKLVLLGDIPDLIRSAHWFDPDVPLENRPWGENGLNFPLPLSGTPPSGRLRSQYSIWSISGMTTRSTI